MSYSSVWKQRYTHMEFPQILWDLALSTSISGQMWQQIIIVNSTN